MIYIILFVLIIIISFFLAIHSMRDFQDLPDKNTSLGLYLIRRVDNLSIDTLNKLYEVCQNKQKKGIPLIFSFEKVLKGEDLALLVFGPKEVLNNFNELELFEVEEYLKMDVKHIQAFELEKKSEDIKNPLDSNSEIFKGLKLDTLEYIIFQIVLSTDLSKINTFQVNIRSVVVSQEANKRVDLSKMLNSNLEKFASLKRVDNVRSSSIVFQALKNRAITPKIVSKFSLNSSQLSNLLTS